MHDLRSIFNMANLRQELPAWYYRLHALTVKEDRDLIPEDFDEDLSSLSDLSVDSEADVRIYIWHPVVNVMGRNSDCKLFNPGR